MCPSSHLQCQRLFVFIYLFIYYWRCCLFSSFPDFFSFWFSFAFPVCSESQYACNTGGQCILKDYFCDGVADCNDGSDEPKGCNAPCLPSERRCKNGRCVSLNLYCDGVDNCGDNSDEVDCTQPKPRPPLNNATITRTQLKREKRVLNSRNGKDSESSEISERSERSESSKNDEASASSHQTDKSLESSQHQSLSIAKVTPTPTPRVTTRKSPSTKFASIFLQPTTTTFASSSLTTTTRRKQASNNNTASSTASKALPAARMESWEKTKQNEQKREESTKKRISLSFSLPLAYNEQIWISLLIRSLK